MAKLMQATQSKHAFPILLILLACASSSLASTFLPASTLPPTPSSTSPTTQTTSPLIIQTPLLFARQAQSCPANYNPCTNLGLSTICCANGNTCTSDFANDVACCPSGSTCTGTLGQTAVYNAGSSTVPNSYYPWTYVSTPFPNQGVCSAALSSCGNTYSSCAAALAGVPLNGVTITAPGVSVLQGGGGNSASAQSICSSLSSQACYGINGAVCAAFPSGGSSGNSGGGTTQVAAGERVDRSLRLVAAGLVIGLVMCI